MSAHIASQSFWREISEKHPTIEATQDQERLLQNFDSSTFLEDNMKHLVHVPKDVSNGLYKGPVNVMIRICGGGLTCGKPEYAPFFKECLKPLIDTHPIIISPYPHLLPEHSGSEVYSTCKVAYEKLPKEIERHLNGRYPKMKASIQWNNILVVGESAGAIQAFHMLCLACFDIGLILLISPLLESYSKPADASYGGETFPPNILENIGLEILQKTASARPVSPPVLGCTPPIGMNNLPITANQTMVVTNAGEPKLESFWSLLYRFPSPADICYAWLESSSPTAQALQKALDLPKSGNYVPPLKIAQHVGNKGMSRLDCGFLEHEGVLCRTITVPKKPARCPMVVMVHDVDDQFIKVTVPVLVTCALQELFGKDTAQIHPVNGSKPPHGFTNFSGSEGVIEEIGNILGWRERESEPCSF